MPPQRAQSAHSQKTRAGHHEMAPHTRSHPPVRERAVQTAWVSRLPGSGEVCQRGLALQEGRRALPARQRHAAKKVVDEESISDIWVIVPTFNEEVVIAQVLTSRQSPYNIVVVDDGSSDKTMQQIAHLPIRVVRHGCNLGTGRRLADGDCRCSPLESRPNFL